MTSRVHREIGGWPLFLEEEERYRPLPSLLLSFSSALSLFSSRVPLDLCRRFALSVPPLIINIPGRYREYTVGAPARARRREREREKQDKCVRINDA